MVTEISAFIGAVACLGAWPRSGLSHHCYSPLTNRSMTTNNVVETGYKEENCCWNKTARESSLNIAYLCIERDFV